MELAVWKGLEFEMKHEFYLYHRPLYLAGENTIVKSITQNSRNSELAPTPFTLTNTKIDELQDVFFEELSICQDPCTSEYNEGDLFNVWQSAVTHFLSREENVDWLK